MNEVPTSHIWNPIDDLAEDLGKLERPDLDRTRQRWNAERLSLHDQTRVETLQEHLATRWAIETGIIEGLYKLDRGMTETLVNLGLGAIETFSSAGRIAPQAARMIEDQRAALDFVFGYLKEDRQLTVSYIRELHQMLTRNQDSYGGVDQFGSRVRLELRGGEFKTQPNNPLTPDGSLHEYCPPVFVNDEMESLISMHDGHIAKGVRPEVEAAWLHHQFTQIHPFPDGNGRVARAVATMVFLKAGFLPLVIRDTEHRETYLDALGSADKGDLAPLVNLFANIQSQDLEDAITFVRQIRGGGIATIARAAADAAKRQVQQHEERTQQLTEQLLDVARNRLREVAAELQAAFREAGVQLDAFVGQNDETNEGWWTGQILSTARKYQYYAEIGRLRRWVQIRLSIPSMEAPRRHIVISFHHKEARAGLMAAVMFMTSSEVGDEDARQPILGSDNEFTYNGDTGDRATEFRAWLESGLRRLLEEWQSRV